MRTWKEDERGNEFRLNVTSVTCQKSIDKKEEDDFITRRVRSGMDEARTDGRGRTILAKVGDGEGLRGGCRLGRSGGPWFEGRRRRRTDA